MFGKITRIVDNSVCQTRRNVICQVSGKPRNLVKKSLRHAQIAMIGQHYGFVAQLCQESDQRCVHLGDVQVDNIRLTNQLPGLQRHARHDDTLGEAKSNRQPHHPDAIGMFVG